MKNNTLRNAMKKHGKNEIEKYLRNSFCSFATSPQFFELPREERIKRIEIYFSLIELINQS